MLEHVPPTLLAALYEAAEADGAEPAALLAEALALYLGRRNETRLPAPGTASPAYTAWLNAAIDEGYASLEHGPALDGEVFFASETAQLRGTRM